MEPSEILRRVVEALEKEGLAYLITGSTATMYYGEPRFTNDLDVVVELKAADVPALLRWFPGPEFYVDDEAAELAVRHHTQFNIIHPRSGFKVDVIVPRMDALDRSSFARRRRVELAGIAAVMSAPEDAILKKLDFFRQGGSEKHLRDIASVLKVAGDTVDRAYVAEWAERLGVLDVWQLILDELQRRSSPV